MTLKGLAGVLLVATLAGCNMHPWRPRDRPTPWIAPETRATESIRTVQGFGGATAESVWRDASGRSYWVNDVQHEIQEFLLATGMSKEWPESNDGNEHGKRRIAPFRFTVVSIHPTVVLMTPFEFGSPHGRSLSELVAPIGDKGCLGNHYMVNDLECDITALYAPAMLWFSHDLKQQPAPISWRAGRAELPIGDEVLVLTHDGAVVRTERQLWKK